MMKWIWFIAILWIGHGSLALAKQKLPDDFSQRFFLGISSKSSKSLGFAYDIDMTKFQMVTREYGLTVIDLTALPYSSPILDSGKRAWSSWWYQKVRREFTGIAGPAILAKYDRAAGLRGRNSALEAELQLEKRSFAPWEGLCDAWALASLFYPEPKRPVIYHGIHFSVADLKGLILKTFEAVPDTDLGLYGEKFLGNSDAWMFPDLFPEQFHRFIEIALGKNKQFFVMDRDPGIEVWNVPVYKANYRIERKPGVPNVVLVKAWLFTAGPNTYEQRENVGTTEVVYEYVYELSGEVSGDRRTLTVNSGVWLKSGFTDSRVNHPDYVLLPKLKLLNRASYNPNINIQTVDEIVSGSL